MKIADGAGRARVPVTAAALTHAGVDPALLTAFAGETVLGGGRPVGGAAGGGAGCGGGRGVRLNGRGLVGQEGASAVGRSAV